MPGGRPPTPTPVLKMRGTYRPDRHDSRLSSVAGGKPICPRHLTGEAKKHWQAVVPPLAAAGVVEKLDTSALTAMCELWLVYRVAHAMWCADPKNKNARIAMIESHRAWSATAQQFGLTPAARARLKTPAAEAKDDFEEFLGGKQKGA